MTFLNHLQIRILRNQSPTWYLLLAIVLGASLSMQPSAEAKLIIEFDYTYDTNGFFDSGTAEGKQRRARLNQAASLLNLNSSLSAITPGGSNTWSTKVLHPGGGLPVTLTDREIAKDTFVLYVGGRTVGDPNSSPGVLGWANPSSGTTASGSAGFVDAVENRGPTIGSFTFVSNNPWHIGETTEGLDSTKSDFLTTAVHEITHLLGIGSSEAWNNLVKSEDGKYYFHGAEAMKVYGGAVPLDEYGSHWAEGTMSTVNGVPQEAMMDPSTSRGNRQLPTALDLAGLKDIGWEVVPEPSSVTLFLVGMVPLFSCRRRNLLLKGRGR